MDTQKLLSYIRQCTKKYNMIQQNDSIAVGLSGGKDSYTLLYGLNKLKKFYPVAFNLHAIYIDLGFENTSKSILDMQQFCENHNIDFHVVKTQISEIVFEKRKEKNPCSLCSKLRKGALNQKALEIGCNKVAYAHHKDDFIETSILSLIFEGNYYCYPPVTKLNKTGLTIIRPLFYVSENEIRKYSTYQKFPLMENPCPVDGTTKREEIKKYIENGKNINPKIKNSMFSSLVNYYENNNLPD